MSDVLIPAGDGTHRAIEADDIRALMGSLTEGAPKGYTQPAPQSWPTAEDATGDSDG